MNNLIYQSISSTIKADLSYILGIEELVRAHNRKFTVYVHLIRTTVNKEVDVGYPTTKGDKDENKDYTYKVIHLVNRQNVIGGVSHIITGDESSPYLLLEFPLDSVFFKRRAKNKNGVSIEIERYSSEIILTSKAKEKNEEGHRDVLVLEIKEE